MQSMETMLARECPAAMLCVKTLFPEEENPVTPPSLRRDAAVSTSAKHTKSPTTHEKPRRCDPEKYKTKLCENWEKFGTCRYDEKCCFAHGVKELRFCARARPALSLR
jgi:hypothetical protein